MIELGDIREAADRIGPIVHRTPLIHSRSFSVMTGADVYLKAENLQKTGSFKVRGAANKLHDMRGKGVIAASMGNHAQGVAYAASRLDIRAKIVMPLSSSIIKQEATKSYGAELVLHGATLQDALEYALQQKEFVFIHPFDDEAVIAGQGTIGIEIMRDLPDADVIIVPVGGGGLIAGIATAVKALSPKTSVIGIQTESATSAFQSCRLGTITAVAPCSTIADGVAVGTVGEKTFPIIREHVKEILTVTEEEIAMAVLLFMERKKLVVEGAGAVPLAAALKYSEKFRGKKIVLVVSGGNIDFTVIDRIIHKGLVSSGRTGVFSVIIDDLPGRLHTLTGVIAGCEGNILDISHDRLAPGLSFGQAKVVFTVETRGKEHLAEILRAIAEAGLSAELLF